MKYIRIIYLAIFTALPFLCFGQKHDYTWMFGYESDLNIEGVETIIGDFNNMPPTFTHVPTHASIRSSSAMISDSLGNLLFYTNGCSIFNRDFEVMENGQEINPGEVHEIQCIEAGFGYTAGSQSCLILPDPGNPVRFYLLHKHISYKNDPHFDVINDTLFYSLINIQDNNGLGRVIQKNIPVISEVLTAGQLTAVKHTNGIDWWIINAADVSNQYYTIFLNQEGFEIHSIQEIGISASQNGSGGGQALFSPDGIKFIRYSAQDGVFLFDFDRENGILSNFVHLPVESEGLGNGAAVSPNSQYLYISAKDTLFQFDLEAEDIFSSGEVVGLYDGYLSPFSTLFHNAQLAPDCKIYINSFATVDVLHVIHNPNEPGLACNFEQHAVQLPFNHLASLPHFPNYRLGPLVEGEAPPPPCEPVVSTEEEALFIRPKAHVFPNPAPGYVKVVFEQALRRPGRAVLYNGLGQVALEAQLEAGSREFRIELSGVAPGLYFYGVFRDGVAVKAGKLVVSR